MPILRVIVKAKVKKKLQWQMTTVHSLNGVPQ